MYPYTFLDWINDHVAVLLLAAIMVVIIVYVIKTMAELVYRCHKMKLKISLPRNAQGVILGKRLCFLISSPEEDESHVGVWGGSGSGKTTGVGIPTLMRWRGNFFAIDISGDISKNVRCSHRLIFEPLNPQSVPYNVFYVLDKLESKVDIDEAINNLALTILPQTATQDAAVYYEKTGRDIITAALLTFYYEGLDFIEICDKIVSTSAPKLLNEIDTIGYSPAIKLINQFETPDGKPSKDLAGSKQAADNALSALVSPRLRETMRRPHPGELSMNAESIESYRCFLNLPDHLLEQYSCVISIVVGQLLSYLSGRDLNKRKRLLVLLDEYASFARSIDIAPLLQKYRKRHIRLICMMQSLSQLDRARGDNYRKEAVDNFGICCICNITEPDSQQYFSRKAGTHTVKRENRSAVTGESMNFTYSQEPVYLPEEFGKLTKHNIILSRGYNLKLRKAYFFKEKSFKSSDIDSDVLYKDLYIPHPDTKINDTFPM